MMVFRKKIDRSQRVVTSEPDADATRIIPRSRASFRHAAALDRREVSFSIGIPAGDPDEAVEFSWDEPGMPRDRRGGEPSAHFLPAGSRLFEYELEMVLGHGGFGATYLALDTGLQERVAIKEYLPNELALRDGTNTVRPRSGEDAALFRRGLDAFLNEARTIARFRHPNVMRVRRFFEANGTGYIVMDFEAGVSFERWAAVGAVTDAALRRLLLALLDGLDIVHAAGVLHRDIKPSNIIVRPDGNPVLVDFGAAREYRMRLSRSLTAIVTAGYAPLEQYGSASSQGPWTDLYGLGAVAYRAVSGKAPPEAVVRLRTDPMVPAVEAGKGRFGADLLRAIDWALAPDERERPQSAAELRDVLLGKAAPPILHRRVEPSRRIADDAGVAPPRKAFAQWVPAAVGALMVLLGGGAIGYLELQPRATPEQSVEARHSLPPPGPHDIVPTATVGANPEKATNPSAAIPPIPVAGPASQPPHALPKADMKTRQLQQKEEAEYRAARGDMQRLDAYVANCRICAFKDAARQEIASLQEQAATARREAVQYRDAHDSIERLQAFLANCRICTFKDAAQQRIASLQERATMARREEIRREEIQYRDARGNLQRLRAYVANCTVCAFKHDAQQQIAWLRDPMPVPHRDGQAGNADIAQREETQYRNAQGDAQQLLIYTTGCTVCAHKAAALREIDKLEEQARNKDAKQLEQTVRALEAKRYPSWHDPPPGSYAESCVDAHIEGDRLVALCRRQSQDARWIANSLPHVHRCVGDIGNNDGRLVCNHR
jgi:serine/threonine protein kinase